MKVSISFKHMDSSPAVEEKINEKLERLGKFFGGEFSVEWSCSASKDVHASEVYVSASHHKFHAHSEKDNLYKTIDEAVEKLERQMSKEAEMQKDKIHR